VKSNRKCVWAVSCMAALAAGCHFPGQPNEDERPKPLSDIRSFPTLFQMNCSGCHGANGTWGPAPPLNDPLFLSCVPDSALVKVISEGRPGTPMPPFLASKGGKLTEKQVMDLVRGLKVHWWPATKPTGFPPYLAEDAKNTRPGRAREGLAVFAMACSRCHGDKGQGGTDDDGNPVGAINEPSFLALISNQALRRIVITGRPDLGMPNYELTIQRQREEQTAQDLADVVALLAAWRTGSKVEK
jgi:cytochrome c oxidase cbb3-type subunit III